MDQRATNPKLGEVFSSHYGEVLAYCARRLGRDEAEDAAADVFAIAVRRADEIDWTTVRPWLYGIARGVLANRWRSRHRRQRLLARIAGAAPWEASGEVVVRPTEDHQAILALDQLRPNDREILMLAAWEEMTGPEIAQALGISRNAAEQRLHRAKTRYARAFSANPALSTGGLPTGGGSR